ncbi:MAG TPA: recombinase family protein [Acidimicrobiales bacterium]|nr:recombinase family protein [Acidimicrobiales bacterium]
MSAGRSRTADACDLQTGGDSTHAPAAAAPKRVALYARVSSDAQATKGTIRSQLDALGWHMNSIGAEVVATYTDDGYSGARLDRPGLDVLRDAAQAGAFEEVWCLSPDRLARSFPYQVLILDELARFGVTVCFTDSPPIDDNPQARLLIQMQGVIAEYERAKLIERARRGKLYRVRAGEAVFGRVPYGYRRVPRDAHSPAYLVIYQPEAAVVRRIFDEYVSGTSFRQIARRLHDDGLPTATGKNMWSPTTISGLLINPTFMGKAAWYRTEHITPPGGGRTQRRRRAQEEWVEVSVPAIVTEETFAAAQAARANHAAFSPRRSTPGQWLLRRLVICGACGIHTRAQQMTSSTGKVNRYYSCAYHDPVLAGGPDRVCQQRRIRADELDSFVYDKIRDVLLRPDVLLDGESALAGSHTPNDELLDTQLDRLARRLEMADAERRRLADLYQAGIIDTQELRRRGTEVTARKATLEAERAELQTQHRELASQNQLRHRLDNFAARIADGFDDLDFDGRQRLLRLVIEQVRVTGWHVEIRLRIPLDDDPGGGTTNNSTKPESPAPKRQSRPHRTANGPVSTQSRLRTVDHHLSLGFALGQAASHVGLSWRVARHAGHHDDPQRVVGLAVTAAVEPVARHLARRRGQRCDPAQLGPGGLGPHPTGVVARGDQQHRRGVGADTDELDEVGSDIHHQPTDLGVEALDLGAEGHGSSTQGGQRRLGRHAHHVDIGVHPQRGHALRRYARKVRPRSVLAARRDR